MKSSTLTLKKYSILLSILSFSGILFSQTPDFKVQHLQNDIGRTGGINTSFTPVASLNNAVALANNNRKTHAGRSNLNNTKIDLVINSKCSVKNTLHFIHLAIIKQ